MLTLLILGSFHPYFLPRLLEFCLFIPPKIQLAFGILFTPVFLLFPSSLFQEKLKLKGASPLTPFKIIYFLHLECFNHPGKML